MSRGEVLETVRRCVAGLRARGLGPGRSVALTTAVTPGAFAAQIAAHLLGCRVTGLRPGLTPAQLEHVLGQGVEVIVADATTAGPTLAAAAGPVPVLDLDADLLATEPDASDDALTAHGRPDDIALITLTSGSTGHPRGCAQPYRAFEEHWSWRPARWSPTVRRLADGYRRFLVFGTLTSAVMLEHLGLCLLAGGTAVIPEHPLVFPQVWERHRITACLCTVPRLYQILDTLRTGTVDTSSMRALLVAGSPLPPHRLAEAVERLGAAVHQGYGQTETGMLSLLTPQDLADGGERVLDSVGRPLPGVGVHVRDPRGRSVPDGTAGEIWVRAGGAMSGYWGDPQETAEVVADGWIRTRDLGVLGEDGYLRLIGRARDVVFVNAVLYYAGAIEAALAAHPDVDQAYVVAAPDERTGEAAHAFVVPAAGRTAPTADVLRAAVRERLGEGAVPATVTVLGAVPVAPGGKPDKKALLSLVADR
ncbi:class I adenylate-forming enzyme family protein [Actinacidiphila polyblastidii]|uniref:class I adenylate-forming enzyme family protein n=1 Tax=Actinacidiphila polyblastidii TaxID=3110430 RepID=UPI0039BCCF55